jgi:putative isomerase
MIENGKQGSSMNRESVDLNAYLCEEKRYLSLITKELSLSAKSDQYQEEYSKLKEDIQTAFWNEEMGWFCDLSLETKEPLQIYGAEGWIPLWTNLAKPEQAVAVAQTMLDTTKFATYIPFPTLTADHPDFKPNHGYWRGPVWLDQAYFAIEGLRNYGYDDEALQFSKNLFDRLEGLKNADDPIRENYHPHIGEGMESKHFSWSAAHLMMLLTE